MTKYNNFNVKCEINFCKNMNNFFNLKYITYNLLTKAWSTLIRKHDKFEIMLILGSALIKSNMEIMI